MHAYVFTDQALMKQAGQFAWLSVDFDNPKNAQFLDHFLVKGVPNFLLIDPKTEKAVMSWYGTVTVAQLQQLLEEKRAAMGKQATGGPEVAMAHGDQLNVEGKYLEAAAAFRQALDTGGPQWPRFARAAESMMLAYELSNNRVQGTQAAMDYAPKLPRGQSFVNVMRIGIQCAARERQTQTEGRLQNFPVVEHLNVLKPLAEEALQVPEGLADDKVGIYLTLVSMARDAKDEKSAEKYATEAWAFLQQQTKLAPSAEARTSLDGARVVMATQLKNPALALPFLEASERDLPDDYNPPMRLASLYTQLNRPDDALAAYQRALPKAGGPRRVSILLSCTTLYEKRGDKPAAKNALEQALKEAEALPEKQAAQFVLKIKSQLAQYSQVDPKK